MKKKTLFRQRKSQKDGGRNFLKLKRIKGDAEGSWIYCSACGAETAMADSYAETISSWNTRKDGETEEYMIEIEGDAT